MKPGTLYGYSDLCKGRINYSLRSGNSVQREKPADPIRLFVYTGSDGSFTLYEDENMNYNYEKGKFSTIPFKYSEKDNALTIGDRQGSYPGMLEQRTFDIVLVKPIQSAEIDFTKKPDYSVLYRGERQVVQF